MKPYKFQPYLKTTIWGGYQIAPFKGIFNAQPNVGESWEISGVPGHESVAVNRGLIDDVDEGLTLVELIRASSNASTHSQTQIPPLHHGKVRAPRVPRPLAYTAQGLERHAHPASDCHTDSKLLT